MAKSETVMMAESIMAQYGGRAFFTYKEVGDIIRLHPNSVGHKLHNAGILVKKIGTKKLVSAYDIAKFMLSDMVSPVDNTSRPA